jgi:hypothetical protein
MTDIYRKLVDLYAGDDLPLELKDELEAEAMSNPDLSHDMMTLKTTVTALRESEAPTFTEESFQRILLKMYTKGAEVEMKEPAHSPYQFRLPLSG